MDQVTNIPPLMHLFNPFYPKFSNYPPYSSSNHFPFFHTFLLTFNKNLKPPFLFLHFFDFFQETF